MSQKHFHGKRLGSIFNNDINNILCDTSGKDCTAGEYKHAILSLLGTRPGVLAQNVGLPDPVIYRSKVATIFSTYLDEVYGAVWPDESNEPAVIQASALNRILDEGTDPLELTIEACCETGTLIVASYRLNSEDFYHGQLDLSDFDRQHRHLRIPGANCLDLACEEVYVHRMDIFREVVQRYDIDGIEFDFRRWYHMISNPLSNYPVLTRMVADTRRLLDEAAGCKGRERLLLGVRVGPLLDGPFKKDEFPGASYGPPENQSCRDLGLDVRTWIEEGYVDYVCPSLFWPRWPGLPKTREFIELAKGTHVGIYPTFFPLPGWMVEGPDAGPIEMTGTKKLLRYKNEFCELALKLYEDGADGISTFNWMPHEQPSMVRNVRIRENWGLGAKKVQMHVHTLLGDCHALQDYRQQPQALPDEGGGVKP